VDVHVRKPIDGGTEAERLLANLLAEPTGMTRKHHQSPLEDPAQINELKESSGINSNVS
jgi:hypothetical protein